jgi:hypothetical protein
MAQRRDQQYPLSDGVFGWRNETRALVTTRHRAPPDSLLARYLHATGQYGALETAWPQGHADLPLLSRLTEYLPGVPHGADEWCVAHVRAGDVIDCDVRPLGDLIGPAASVSRFRVAPGCAPRMVAIVNRQRQRYVKPVEYYVRALAEHNCTAALVLAHAHFSSYESKIQHDERQATRPLRPSVHRSALYLSALVAALCAHGVDVTLRTDGGTDGDFALMVRARKFVSGGGGYSRLAVVARAERARMRGSKRAVAERAQREAHSTQPAALDKASTYVSSQHSTRAESKG